MKKVFLAVCFSAFALPAVASDGCEKAVAEAFKAAPADVADIYAHIHEKAGKACKSDAQFDDAFEKHYLPYLKRTQKD